ncbi:hypothetical protein [Ferrimonas senticii]|uniref:hypothetical protein n=1 Tax=Ferrimonas senticii TaxID=394566 RepID=UPI000426BCCA|nr:hypothetical protein [Ferrimonas senticii]
MLMMLLAASLSGSPFLPSNEYHCAAGPHRFQLQVDHRGEIYVHRYLLSNDNYLSMPPMQATGVLQWHTLDNNHIPTALMRLHPQTLELYIAWLDDDGGLLRSDRHFTECISG